MSSRTFACVLVAVMGLGLGVGPGMAQSPTARLATYQKDGQTFFALSLLSQEKPDPSQKNDVVLLVDTSASQAGRVRNEQLAVLEALVAALEPSDRVALMAVDGRAVLLSDGWVAPTGPAMDAAMAKLRVRVPLGATDLEAGLRAAVTQLTSGAAAAEGLRARTVIYVGDGMSKLNTLTEGALERLVRDLRKAQVSVSSYALGIEKNLHLLSVLANHTGGVVAVSGQGVDAAEVGRALAASVRAGVIWPEAVEFSGPVAQVLPPQELMPPLRTDRDSIVLGTLTSSGPVRVVLKGTLNGRPVQSSWEVTPEKPSEDFAFLPKLVEAAAQDKGLTLPTVGSAGLREAAYALMHGAEQMVKQAQEALARGDFEGAKRVAETALARDPEHPEAKAILETARKALATGKLPPPAEAELKLAGAVAGAPADLTLELASEPPGLALRVDEERKVVASKARAEVEQTLAEARRMMSSQPDQAEQVLKLRLDQIERMPELEPELRGQLRQQIELALQQVRQARLVQDQRREEALERQARAQEQERLNDALVLREQRITQIVERFASLMKEQRYDVADEEITPEIQKIARGTSIDSSLIYGGRFERATHESEELWRRRHDQFVRAMHRVEVALVPFPDEPPIVYPPAEQWQQLTLDRQKYKAVDLGRPGGAEERIFKALQEPTTIEVAEMPLKDVISYLQETHNIPIVLMTKKLEEAGIQPDVPVTKTLRGITLRSALRLILKELELTYIVRDEVLQITTPEDAEGQLITKVYPVGDLVVPPSNFMAMMGGMMGGMGGMNGMMGGMMNGGMMGGGMGMGMGGMGMGGMGGMGMGGMGMGGMGGMFAVEDDLTLRPNKPAAAAPASAAPAPTSAKTQPSAPAASPKGAAPAPRITVQPAAGQSLAEAWDTYFATQASQLGALEDPAPALKQLLARVRQTVRELMDEKKYDEIATLIPAALRHGQMEPWMYEALALALRAKALSHPLSEQEQELLERALLSAVDFAKDEDQAILIAAYLAQAGLPRRALEVYREVAKVSPSRPEPYLQGLALAQQLNDVEAIQWGCLGILAQAWPADQQQIPERAFRIARATYEQLRSEGRIQEAQVLDAAVRRAQARDCVVVVTWTGEADVDLLVEEPAGTVVSQWQPRSIGGGVYLGDVTSLLPSAPPGSQSEAYVCPEGFSGQYRLLIKNVWGRPTSGKVTVDVYTHYGTDRQTQIHEQIQLEDKNALVLFELKNGRRTDPLPEVQVAKVRIENAANRALLAQQLAAANPQAAQNFAASLSNSNPLFPVFPGFPGFFLPGAVGYRPVITALTSGANMTIPGNTVISADRRYVRTGPAPFFTQVTEVSTFNFVTGQQGNTQQLGGGFGGGFGGGGLF